MKKRKVEIFTEGCPRCEPTVELVKSLSCEMCEVVVYDLSKGCDSNICRELVKEYGVEKFPSVAVDGKMLECCKNGNGPTERTLRAAGIGRN